MTAATVNGEPRTLPDEATVATVVGLLTQQRTGVAVALNGEVVPLHKWSSTYVDEGDAVEVLTAVQGG